MTEPLFFLETHHYDGGIQVRHFGCDRRPTWAPPFEAVAPKEDASLYPETVLVEFSRFASADGQAVNWIGVYVKARDIQFGDRANYACAGIWTMGHVIRYVPDLLAQLHAGARHLASAGMTENLAKNFSLLYEGVKPSVRRQSDYPPACGGVSPAESTFGERKVVLLDQAPLACQFSAVGTAVVDLSIGPFPFVPVPRVVFLLGSDGKDWGDVERLPPPETFFPQLADSLPTIWSESSGAYAKLEEESRSLRIELAKMTRAYQVEVEASSRERERAQSLEQRFRDAAAELTRYQMMPGQSLSARLDALTKEVAQLRALGRTPGDRDPYAPTLHNVATRSDSRVLPIASRREWPKWATWSFWILGALAFLVLVFFATGRIYDWASK